jgi:hypothetical protein
VLLSTVRAGRNIINRTATGGRRSVELGWLFMPGLGSNTWIRTSGPCSDRVKGDIEGTVSASLIRAPRPVPPEFAGQARAFRNRILADDDRVAPAIGAITTYARDVLRRRHTYRPEHFKHLERAWRLTIPNTGRLAYATECGKNTLTIADTRICSFTFHKGV